MLIKNILSNKGAKVMMIGPDAQISEIAKILKEKRIGVLVVSTDNVHVDGIVSERDVVYGLVEHGPGMLQLPVSSLMTKKLITCTPDSTVAEVMNIMSNNHVRHVPVMEGSALAGIVSIGDVVKSRLDEMELETNVLRDVAIARS